MRRDQPTTMRRALIAMAMLLATGASGLAEDQPSAATPEPQWTEFQSPERGFAIQFPGTPQTTTAPVEGQNPLIQYDFQVGVGDDEAYRVVVFEYPAGRAPSPSDPDYFAKLASAYAKGSGSNLRKKGPPPSPTAPATRRLPTTARASSIISSTSCRQATAFTC